MPGPANAPLGDQQFDQLPQTQVPEKDLSREVNMAKFSQSEEFGSLKAAIESRIAHYQTMMPGNGNVAISQLPNEERGYIWLAADTIINEFRSIIDAYEQAKDAVKAANDPESK